MKIMGGLGSTNTGRQSTTNHGNHSVYDVLKACFRAG